MMNLDEANKLFNEHHKLALHVACKRKRTKNMTLADKEQAALCGLWCACLNARPHTAKGEFETYARRRIEGAISDAMRRNNCHRDARSTIKPVQFEPLEDNAKNRAQRAVEPDDGEEWQRVQTMLAPLTPLQRIILYATVVKGVPSAEISRRLGMSEARACQLRQAAIARLRELNPTGGIA